MNGLAAPGSYRIFIDGFEAQHISERNQIPVGSDHCINNDLFNQITVKNAILSAGIPEFEVSQFHNKIFKIIAADAPAGFVGGELLLSSAPIDDDLPLNYEAVDSIVHLEGTFVPNESVDEIILARVYSQRGLHVTSIVGPDGHFSLTLTDIIPGRTPFILTFSSPVNGRRRRQLFVEETTATPCLFWCISNDTCSPGLSFKLTWDSETSDLDLHVIEPSGLDVYYGDMIGDCGALDVDDRHGFGPEHYTALFVDLFDVGYDALPIGYTLEALHESKLFWTRSGNFSSEWESSGDFFVTTATDQTSCAVCSASSGTSDARRMLADDEAESLDYSKVPEICMSCMDKWGGWCNIGGPLGYCDDDDAKDSWKMYQNPTKAEPKKDDIQFHINIILAPIANKMSHMRANFELYLYGIKQGRGDYECLKYKLLDAFCRISFSKDMEFWIKLCRNWQPISLRLEKLPPLRLLSRPF